MNKLAKFAVSGVYAGVLGLASLTMLTPAIAAPVVFGANLTPGQEVPGVTSPGSGSATVTLDGSLLSVSLIFSGLTSGTLFAHIHCCAAPGANAPVAIDFGAGFPAGVTAGTFSATFDLTNSATYSAGFRTANPSFQSAFINGLSSGLAYINVHTATNRGGEIRGQIPLPTSLALLVPGLLGLGLMRARQRG